MSSLHKRLVHRSTNGCCICKAKSSSSRFTSSGKYEDFFSTCFHISEPRGGEICNACVLLVKRYKKLPSGSSRHWAHVVDARAGPGVKNFVRERRRESCRERSLACAYKRKHVYGRKKMKSEDIVKISKDTSMVESNLKTNIGPKVSDFIDLRVWKRKRVCCGTIFVGPLGETMVDPRFLQPCQKKQQQNISESFSKSLMAFETIVEKELQDISKSSSAIISDKRNLSNICNEKFPVFSDQDEGFFDRSSTSPCFEDNLSPKPVKYFD